MDILHTIARLAPNTAACLGAFDGLHLGHQALLNRASELAPHIAVVTFEHHPAHVLAPGHGPALLQSNRQRERVCRALHVDTLVFLPFDREVASWSAHEFVHRVLIGGLSPSVLIVGTDFRFGRSRSGGVEELHTWLSNAGIAVEVVTPIAPPMGMPGTKLGSSAIRTAVARGDVEQAAAMLGRWYALSGTVVTGARRGRSLGFPTANIASDSTLMSANGVYATFLSVWDETSALFGRVWPSVTNVGTNPTFSHGEPQAPWLETHVLDEDLGEALYGLDVEVSFLARLRDEQRFTSVGALVAQIHADIAAARPSFTSSAFEQTILPARST